MQKKSPVFQSVRALTIAAMLTAVSVVIGIFCKNFLNFGAGLFRISFESFPIILSGFLFGPVVGGFVGAATDLISYLLSGQIYPPNLLVMMGAALLGILSGICYRLPIKREKLRIVISVGVAHLIGSMFVKIVGLYQFYGIAALWRIPVYLAIAAIEAAFLCILLERKSIRQLIVRVEGSPHDLSGNT